MALADDGRAERHGARHTAKPSGAPHPHPSAAAGAEPPYADGSITVADPDAEREYTRNQFSRASRATRASRASRASRATNAARHQGATNFNPDPNPKRFAARASRHHGSSGEQEAVKSVAFADSLPEI